MDYNANFEANYKREADIHALYKEADTEEERAEVLARMDAFKSELKNKGLEYNKIYRHYVQMKNRGNRYINFDDVIQSPAELIATLRKFGIDIFTFSSRWSGMIDNLADFIAAGCQFCGVTEIYSHYKVAFSDDYEKEKAIILFIPEA